MTQLRTVAVAAMLALGLAACNEDDGEVGADAVEETEVPIETAPAPATD